ncbi:Vacuolar iron transporter 2 [Linum grandiflorum]
MVANGNTSPSSEVTAGAVVHVHESINDNQLSQKLLLEDHKEKHFLSRELVRDIIIGLSDGLTVPFALAAGLSGVEATSQLILVAGVAEVAAGAISMGLGGYLAAQSEADHYMRELKREEQEIILVPDIEAAECGEILAQYGVAPDEAEPVLNALRRNPHHWLSFMMKFELGLEKPESTRAIQSAATIAASYVVGGIFPLLPYMVISSSGKAVVASVAVTLAALVAFGFVKAHFAGDKKARFRTAVQTAFVGALACSAAYGIARLVRTSTYTPAINN